MPAPPPTETSIREIHRSRSWTALVRSDLGLVRRRLEDAWKVLLRARLGGRPVAAFAVFDGLGGEPHGQEAAWAAADELESVLAAAHNTDPVLRALSARVRKTGGATTAVAALLLEGPGEASGTLLAVGDSAAYGLDPSGRVRLLAPKDSGGTSVVADYLGNPELRGHAVPLALKPGEVLLLCTDGVDDVVGTSAIAECLTGAREGPEESLRTLFEGVHAAGAPDNATAVLVLRT